MSASESNVVPMTAPARAREYKPRWTEKRIAELKAQQFAEGYRDGHETGWKECQRVKPTPFADFLAGAAIVAIGWGLDRWFI